MAAPLLAVFLSLPLAADGRSIAELRAAAARGSAAAEYELAEQLAVDGVDEHRAEAVVWLRRAAAQGHADAQTHLSWAYHMGVGVKANDAKAVRWERLAARKGQASAQYYLGADYELGLGGLPKDSAQAAAWYRRAAEQDHPIAQARLGDLYAEGRGVPRDDREAIAWYLRAALQGDFRGELGYALMCAAGRGMPKDEEKALEWFQRAEEQQAKTVLSAIADEGEMSPSVKRDYGLAMVAERQPPSAGVTAEREKWIAMLHARQRAKNGLDATAAILPAKAEEFCPALAAVMAAATTNFVAIRGKGSEASGWEATKALPGMQSCKIESAGDNDDAAPFTYRCTIAEDAPGASASAGREGAKQLVSHCLGASWHATEIPHSNRVIVFFSNDASPLQIELFQLEFFSKHTVTLSVDAPLAPLTLTQSRPGGAIDLDSPVDFKSEKAGIGNVAHAFAHLLGADLVIDLGLKGKVSFDRANIPLREALDAVCAQAGCAWSFNQGRGRPELYIHAAGASK